MGEGARFPSAMVMAQAWLKAAELTGYREYVGLVEAASGQFRDLSRHECRWLVFQAIRCAGTGVPWAAAARMSDLPEDIDFADLGAAIQRRGANVFWPSVQRVFVILMREAA